MKFFLSMLVCVIMTASFTGCGMVFGQRLSASQVETALGSDDTLLVDVREPVEWQAGVVEGAVLLPLSDLRGKRLQWQAFLEENGKKKLLLYCRTGNRSGIAGKILKDEGFQIANAGGFSQLKAAGLPTIIPEK